MTIPLSREPAISIGLPVYNGEVYLAEALDATLAQTLGNFELIICDNASTDRTEEICRDYAACDRRIRYVRNTANLGAARNYRLAFELSSGMYFRWANHDDTIAPTLLERCFEVLERRPTVVLTYGRTTLIDACGQPLSNYQDQMHIQSSDPVERFQNVITNIGMCNVIYGLMRRDAMKRTALMCDHIGSDLSFVAELALYGTFLEIPEPLFFRRIHSAAYSSQKDPRNLAQFYNPNTRSGASLPTIHRIWTDALAVERSPLSFSEKMKLELYLLRSCFWKRSRLIQETKAYFAKRLASRRADEMM